MKKLAIITGASSGIGEATSYKLASSGYDLGICARRKERLDEVAENCRRLGANVITTEADITLAEDRAKFIKKSTESMSRKINLLFNNAGLALGTAPFAETLEEDVRQMFETNVFAVQEMTKLALPLMDENGHIIFMGSIAGYQSYEGGSAYCASKHALRAMYESLRQEMAASDIRLSTISPGMVDTEFSKVRFKGDMDKAKKVYDGITALTGDDIAECVHWILSLPDHVNIGDIKIFPRHQADARKIHRKS